MKDIMILIVLYTMDSISQGQIITIEELIGKHSCVVCEKTYVQKSSLNRHLRETNCGGNKPNFQIKRLKEIANLKEISRLKEINKKLIEQTMFLLKKKHNLIEYYSKLQLNSDLSLPINHNKLKIICVNANPKIDVESAELVEDCHTLDK
jgi:hypothetical protein